MPQSAPPGDKTSYFRLDGRDTTGRPIPMYAAYRNNEFVLFQVGDDGVAQALYLYPAPSVSDIGRIVTQHVMDVGLLKPIDRPDFGAARLVGGHAWTAMDGGKVGVILETRDVR